MKFLRNIKQQVLTAVLYLFLTMQSLMAAGGGEPWDGPLDWFVETVTGPTGTTIAVIVIICAGLAAFVGRLTWAWAGRIAGGIILIFGAVTIADLLIETVA